MARNSGVLFPAATGVTQAALLAGFLNAGLTKVADDTERIALTAPTVVNGITPDEFVVQLDTMQLYRWDGSPPALIPIFFNLRFSPPEQLAGLLEAESTATATLTPSVAARQYAATIGQGTEFIAVDIGRGYPNQIIEPITNVDGTVTENIIPISPLRGEYRGGYMVFTLASPLNSSASQTTIRLRGSELANAVLSPDIFSGTGGAGPGTGGSLTGFTPANLGTVAGQFLRTNLTNTYWSNIAISDVFGARIGSPNVGDTLYYSATGWVYNPAAAGVPISSGNINDVLYKTGTNTSQFAPLSFANIPGHLPEGKLPDVAGHDVGDILQIIDNVGTHEWAVQTPVFVLNDNAVTPPKLDAGDAAKRLALRQALGFPSGTAGQPLLLAAGNAIVAGYNHFPTDDTLALRASASTFQRITAVNPQRFQFRSTAGINFIELALAPPPAVTTAQVTTPAGYSLELIANGIELSSGATGNIDFQGAGLSAGLRFKQGEVLGQGANGPEALSFGHPALVTAHWTGTITAGSGASGNGFDTQTGNTFGSVTPNTFVYNGTTYTIQQVIQDSSNGIKITIKPVTTAIDDNWSFTINGHLTLNSSDATITGVARYGGISTEYEWSGQRADTIPSTGSVTVSLNRQTRAIPEGGQTDWYITQDSSGNLLWKALPAGSPGQPGATTFAALTDTNITSPTEYQVVRYNAAGQLVNDSLGTLLGRISNPGRNVVWVKPSTGPGSQYSDTISTGVVLPSDFRSYDFIYWETASTSADYLAGNITDFRIWPTNLLGSASQTDVDGSRVDWSASNRTLSAGNTPDRFLRVVLMRGQGPPGPMGAAGTPGSGGANLQTSGVPSNLALVAARGTASTASRSDHIHSSVLPDDSIQPGKIIADSAVEKQAWQTRIGEDESSSFIFWRSSITSAGSDGFSLLSTGTISDATFDYENTTYTVRKWESDGVGSFAINITPDPGATTFNNLVAHFNGISLKFSDATSSTSTSFLPPSFSDPGREWTWTGNHSDIIPTTGTTAIALAEDIGTAINDLESDIAAIRQPPVTPSDPTNKWLRGDNTYQNLPALIRRTYESNAIATISQTTVRDRVPRTVTLASLSGDHAAQGLTLSANAITVARPGLYHVAYDLDVSIVSAFQVHLNRGNTNQRGTVRKFYPFPGQEDGQVALPGVINITDANQTISMQWLGLDIPALAGQVPQAPSAISITRLAGNTDEFTIGWTYSGRRVNTWNIQYRFVNEVVWHSDITQVNRQAARSVALDTHHTGNTGIDVRVWGTNASGDGLYAQRTWGTTGTDGVFTTQTAHSQTVSAVGDLVIRSEEISNA